MVVGLSSDRPQVVGSCRGGTDREHPEAVQLEARVAVGFPKLPVASVPFEHLRFADGGVVHLDKQSLGRAVCAGENAESIGADGVAWAGSKAAVNLAALTPIDQLRVGAWPQRQGQRDVELGNLEGVLDVGAGDLIALHHPADAIRLLSRSLCYYGERRGSNGVDQPHLRLRHAVAHGDDGGDEAIQIPRLPETAQAALNGLAGVGPAVEPRDVRGHVF